MLRVSDVAKMYGRGKSAVRALDQVSLDVAPGEFLVLLGPSGCGKTTLLRSIAGLIRPTSGRIELHDRAVFDSRSGAWLPPHKRDIGMVFQQFALWPHMTVEQNVQYPLRARGRRAEVRRGRVAEVLDIVQCGALSKRYPSELSGGQQQRVSLARALAARPAVMLMDEPLSSLDAMLRLDLRAELRRVHEEVRFTAVYVTHDQVEALSLASRVVVMRQGLIEQEGTPSEVYSAPVSEYVAEFLGARVRLTLEVAKDGRVVIEGQPADRLAGRFAPGSTISVRLRSTNLHLRVPGAADSTPGAIWLTGGRVVASLLGGQTTEYLVDIGRARTTVEAPTGSFQYQPGDSVDVGVDFGHAHVYPTHRADGRQDTDNVTPARAADDDVRALTPTAGE